MRQSTYPTMSGLSATWTPPEQGGFPPEESGYPYPSGGGEPVPSGGSGTIAEAIAQLYRQFLNRDASPEEVASAIQGSGGGNLAAVMQGIMESPEYQAILRPLLAAWYTQYLDREMTDADFRAHLGNPGGPAGIEQTIKESPDAKRVATTKPAPTPTPKPDQPPAPAPGAFGKYWNQMQGFDATKMQNATHKTIKYEVARILQNYEPTPAGLKAAAADLAKLGVTLVAGGSGDKIKLPDGAVIDVGLKFSTGGGGWWWGDDRGTTAATTPEATPAPTTAPTVAPSGTPVPTTPGWTAPTGPVAGPPDAPQYGPSPTFGQAQFAPAPRMQPNPVMSEDPYRRLLGGQAPPTLAQLAKPFQPYRPRV